MKADDEPRARESRAWSSGVGGKTHQAEGRGDLSDRMWLSPVSKSLVLQRGPLADADSPTLPRMQEYNRGCTGPHVTSTLRVSASFDQVDEQIQTHLRMSGTLGTFRVPMKKQTAGLRCMDPSPTCSPRGYPPSASGGKVQTLEM